MTISKTVLDSIGNTPLIEYDDGSDSSQRARILMKAEYLNPSGSLKDRMAYRIIKELEDSGQLKPGGTVVEATAGNTGIAVAMICAMKGYKSVFTMPDKFSTEKINMLKAYGSQVITVPTNVPDDHPDSWKEVAKRIVSETPNSPAKRSVLGSVFPVRGANCCTPRSASSPKFAPLLRLALR